MPITPELLAQHGLTAAEYEKIRGLLGREPNLTELGVFSVMLSEHCSYKSSRVHLKALPTSGPHILQGPGENAGIIDVGEGWACAFKIESHNHPSYVEPFQGAATGVGGILRDVFTMGARPVAIMDSLRFGPLSTAKNHAILEGVVGGIAHYGNCFGVANLGGETVFDPCYSGNPLVNAFALGIARRNQLFFGRATGVGNPVIYVGAKTGRDGIHGATMASEEFSAASAAKRPNVQVGDPFLEKLLLEACLEAMATGAILGIQDMGAAGLTSSSCEMGARAGTGIELDLDRVPQRETGMTAYEMLLSESQERMLLVAQAGREEEVFAVFGKWGLDAVTVGVVTADGHMRVRHRGAVVADIANAALTDEAPRYQRPQQAPARTLPLEPRPEWLPGRERDLQADFLALLAAPNVCSKAWIYEQYDTMVRTNTLQGPGGDAGVIRLKGTTRGLAMALDGNGRYCQLDPRQGARLAVAEAARKVACVGAQPVAATNCLNFGNPEKPEVMWQLAEAIAGLGEACRALGTPITGGNVSLYNETLGQGIQPTPVVGVVGLVDLSQGLQPLGAGFRAAGSAILLLSGAPPQTPEEARRRFGGSEYAAAVLGQTWGLPPALDLDGEQKLQEVVVKAHEWGWLQSAHQVSTGGLAVCLAECCLARSVESAARLRPGAAVDLQTDAEPWLALFDETASRVVVSCAQEDVEEVTLLTQKNGIRAIALGQTQAEADGFHIACQGRTLIALPLSAMATAWEESLARQLEPQAASA
ncbi:MAG TPA: phosphoribosylformylglycinamidine synthase subunit PurL [Terriglobales bacterium]|nr:phosphoribosylformylglycinamidine synthase subunit PurL [Terriglobales bacterium]